MTPTKRYPSGPITPHGAYHLLKGNHPVVTLRSYNDAIVFNMLGGPAIPARTAPESVHIKDIKGLIPPWKTIDQKGATEDGVTFVDALYDPMEVDVTAVARGRDAEHLREVVRDLIDSIDVKQTSELGWWTQKLGYWWAPVRWFKTPPNTMSVGGQRRKQELGLTLRADNGFWRSYNDSDSFSFDYNSMIDTFTTSYSTGLGPNWPLYYWEGSGGGYIRADGDDARWVDDPDDLFTTHSRAVVCGPYKNYSSTGDNQVMSMVYGSLPEWSFPTGAHNDVWCRMSRNPDGTWKGDGIRLRVGHGLLKITAFVNFVAVWERSQAIIVPPLPGEKYTLVAGYEGTGNERVFKAMRNNSEVFTVKESGTQSKIGPPYRGVGLGMRASAALITQATPAKVRKVSGGDNNTVSQSGFLRRINAGDQPMPDRYTLYGPGTFKIGNGPNTTEMVEFGPLLPNQIVQIRTDPNGLRGVVDLTVVPPTPQELNWFQEALQDFISFATGNNVPPLLREIESKFGIVPPQGNLYSLMSGRFSHPIPAKEPGKPAEPYYVAVSIDDGNADSKIVATGTPLRRYPQ